MLSYCTLCVIFDEPPTGPRNPNRLHSWKPEKKVAKSYQKFTPLLTVITSFENNQTDKHVYYVKTASVSCPSKKSTIALTKLVLKIRLISNIVKNTVFSRTTILLATSVGFSKEVETFDELKGKETNELYRDEFCMERSWTREKNRWLGRLVPNPRSFYGYGKRAVVTCSYK